MAHSLTLNSAPQAIMRHVEALSSASSDREAPRQIQGDLTARTVTVNKKGTRRLGNLETVLSPSENTLRPTPEYRVRLSPDLSGVEHLTISSPMVGHETGAALGNTLSLRELTARASNAIYLSKKAVSFYEEIGMFPGEEYSKLLKLHRQGGHGLISLDFKRSWVPALPVALALHVMPPYMLDKSGRVITRRMYLSRLFDIDVVSFDRLRSTYELRTVQQRERDYARDEHALLSAKDRGLAW